MPCNLSEGGWIAIAPDGKFYRFRQGERIDNAQQIILDAASKAPKAVPGAFMVGDQTANLAVSNNVSTVCVRLKGLRLDTNWISIQNVLMPQFAISSRTVRMAHVWEPPASMELYFAANGLRQTIHWRLADCFLFARKVGAPGFYRPFLANLYDDGRVCMGEHAYRAATLDALWPIAKKHLDESTWNADLMPQSERVRATQTLIRFSPDGKQLPVPDNWETLCGRCSRVEMEALFP